MPPPATPAAQAPTSEAVASRPVWLVGCGWWGPGRGVAGGVWLVRLVAAWVAGVVGDWCGWRGVFCDILR